MSIQKIVEPPVKLPFNPPPLLWATAGLCVTLYGVFFKHWNLQPLVYLFWLEVIFAVGAMLVRIVFALDGRPWQANFGRRFTALLVGLFLGIAMIMLTVTFTFKVFDEGFNPEGFQGIRTQALLLLINAALALVFHYFLNGKFRTAQPIDEAMSTFVYLLILLCVLMAVTMHLIPAYPQLNQSMWTGVAVVLIKFVIDALLRYRFRQG